MADHRQDLKEWSSQTFHLEPVGNLGRGWSNERFSARSFLPTVSPDFADPKAWTPGTKWR